MLTRPVRHEVVPETYSTKWHSIKGRYLPLFDSKFVDQVERWYNTIAPARMRDQFRAVMKKILLTEPQPPPQDDVLQCKVDSLVRLYAGPLSAAGKQRVMTWLASASTTPTDIDAFRDVFTGVLALSTEQSHFKRVFQYRPLPDILSKTANRQKIDWSNTNAAKQGQQRAKEADPAAADAVAQGDSSPPSRRQQPGGRTSRRTTVTEDSQEKIAELERKRELYRQSDKYLVDEGTGCSIFTASTGSPRREAGVSKTRVMASFQSDGTDGWISTTREMIRNYGSKAHAERVERDSHPAIALTTASTGLCVPSLTKRRPQSSLD